VIDQNQAISLALDNNQLVKAAERMVESAKAEGKARYAPFLPQFNTTYSYTRLDKAPTTTFDLGSGPETIPVGTADNYEWDFQFVFPIYAGEAKPAIKKMIGINQDIAQNNLNIARRGISNGTSQVFFGVLSTQYLIGVRSSTVDYLTEAYGNALKFQQQGFFPTSEVLQIEVAKGRAEMDLRAAKDLERSTRLSLAQMLGLDYSQVIELKGPDNPPQVKDLDRNAIKNLAESRNGDIKQLDLQIKMLEQQKKVSRSAKQPSLNFVSRYTNKGDTALVNGNGFGDPNQLTATLQLSWSIFDSGKVSEEQKQMKESLAALNLQRNDSAQKLAISVEQAFDDYVRSLDNIEVSKHNLASAEENFRVLNKRYGEGLERSTDILQGEATLSGAKLEYNQSIYDSYTNLSKLAMVAGFETSDEFIKALSSSGTTLNNKAN